MTTSSAASGKKFGKMTTFPFQCTHIYFDEYLHTMYTMTPLGSFVNRLLWYGLVILLHSFVSDVITYPCRKFDCLAKLWVIIGPGKGLSSNRIQVLIWTNDDYIRIKFLRNLNQNHIWKIIWRNNTRIEPQVSLCRIHIQYWLSTDCAGNFENNFRCIKWR